MFSVKEKIAISPSGRSVAQQLSRARNAPLTRQSPSPVRRVLSPGQKILQPKWVTVQDKSYEEWDQVIAGEKWFRKWTELGFQYSHEQKDKNYPIKIFVRLATMGGKIPEQLLPPRTGIVFGTQARTAAQVIEAYTMGYRSFDTAESYMNIKEVMAAFKELSAPREEITILYKFYIRQNSLESSAHLIEIAQLFGGYLDTVMIHNLSDNRRLNQNTITEMDKLKTKTVVRHIGLSNVEGIHLRTLDLTGVEAIENSVNLENADEAVRVFCLQNKIKYYGFNFIPLIAKDDKVNQLVETYKGKVTYMGLLMAWAAHYGVTPIMSSKDMERNKGNLNARLEDVPSAAVKALDEIVHAKLQKKKITSIQDLPLLPARLIEFGGEIEKLTYLNNDQWMTARMRYVPAKLKINAILGPHIEQVVPAVDEVASTFHGALVRELVFQLNTTNHCDILKIVMALLAGMRNVEK